MEKYEVIIVGGGPSGLSAAMILGRCRRNVLVCDSGEPRNAASDAIHGFLTRDNISPIEFLKLARADLHQYETVAIRDIEVIDAKAVFDGFEVDLKDGTRLFCSKLLLATGVVDHLPQVEGIKEFYGRSVFHCPYCDGWEFKNLPIAVYGNEKRGHGLSLELLTWTDRIILCTDGPTKLSADEKKELERNSIVIVDARIKRLEGESGKLKRIRFADEQTVECAAMFFTLGQKQRSNLPEKLGCEFTEKGSVETDSYETTCVPNLYVVGDASEEVQFVIVGAAEGAKAAFAINKSLAAKDLK